MTSFDVIYSLPDEIERSAVAEMFRVLKPGGHLVVNVAAMPLLRGSHSILSNEIRRYSRPDLRTTLDRAGFEVLRVTYTNLTTLPLTAAVRFAQRFMGGHQESAAEITVPPMAVNALLSGLLALESLALKVTNMPAGSSLLALARKPVNR